MSTAPDKPRDLRAISMLLVVCAIWAVAFPCLTIGQRAVEGVFGTEAKFENGAFYLTVRFLIAALAMPLLMPRCLKGLNRGSLWRGAALGVFFSAHLITQMIGMALGVPPGQSAFITALFVVFAPFFAFVAQGRKPRVGVLLGIPLALAGVSMISGKPSLEVTPGMAWTLAAAAIYGGQIVLTDTITRGRDTLSATFAMIAFSAVLCFGGLVAAPRGMEYFDTVKLAALAADWRFWATEVYLAVISSVAALALVNRWQREVSPNHAAIIFTTVPVMASVVSIMLGEEVLTWGLVAGAVMILAANLCAEFLGRGKR